MRSLRCPAIHSEFESKVANSRAAVRSAVESNLPPNFPSDWGDFKMEFMKAQNGKCGFCEGPVLGLHYGDVEHFRPKAEVTALDEEDPDSWGREVPWQSTVVGRRFKAHVTKPGYWWLAYDWRNYLLSCQICNQQWKGSLFPVAVKGVALDQNTVHNEVNLLISPFEEFEPADHFEYGRLGEVVGRTDRGRATVLTCGLDRPSLRIARYPIAKHVHEQLDDIAEDVNDRELLRLLTYVLQAGAESRPHCGMVHAIFRARTGLAWSQLSTLIVALTSRK